MSGSVKLKLPAGGSKTLSAPDSASDETITLPAGTKTLATVENFTSTGIDDNATSTKLTTTSTGIDVTGTVAATAFTGDGSALTGMPAAGANTSLSNLSATGNSRVCTGWVSFNAVGTLSIKDSYNVSSVTDHGVALYGVNWATEIGHANYCPSVNMGHNTNDLADTYNDAVPNFGVVTSSKLMITLEGVGGQTSDWYHVAVSVFS